MNEILLNNVSFVVLFGLMLWAWLQPLIPSLQQKTNVTTIGMWIVNLLLASVLLIRWINAGHFPLSNLYESLIFLAWAFTSMHLVCASFIQLPFLAAITAPTTLLTFTFATFSLPKEMQKASALVPALQSNWLMMHVSMMMISYATLIIGSLLSILYLFFILFNKNLSTVSELSSLNNSSEVSSLVTINNLTTVNFSKLSLLKTIDTWSYRIIGLGFPFLTIGIISGAVWANEAWGSYWSWDPKETWALITWLVFASYLHSRLIKGWEGIQAAKLGSCGFFVIWICYLGVNFLGKGLHSYGWVL